MTFARIHADLLGTALQSIPRLVVRLQPVVTPFVQLIQFVAKNLGINCVLTWQQPTAIHPSQSTINARKQLRFRWEYFHSHFLQQLQEIIRFHLIALRFHHQSLLHGVFQLQFRAFQTLLLEPYSTTAPQILDNWSLEQCFRAGMHLRQRSIRHWKVMGLPILYERLTGVSETITKSR